MRGTTDPTAGHNELAESHLSLVQHVLNQVAARYPRHVERAELWSAGARGLVEASRRYDPSTGVPFARYAAIRIRGAIIDAARSRDWASRSLRREMRTVATVTQAFEERHGRTPSTAELAADLELSVDQLEQHRSAAATANLLQLDQPLGQGDGPDGSLGDRVPEADTDRLPEEALEQRELIATVRSAVRFLPDVQREVIERYFFRQELLRDIAEHLGVTEARVSQIRSEALNAMKAYFATLYDGVEEIPAGAPGSRRRAAYVEEMSASSWRDRLQGAAEETPLAAGAR